MDPSNTERKAREQALEAYKMLRVSLPMEASLNGAIDAYVRSKRRATRESTSAQLEGKS